jgi:Flp pilus assembly pilin Flp
MDFYVLHLVDHAGRLWRNKKAQDLIEYALLGGFIAVAVAVVFPTSIAPNISTVFSKVVSILGLVR